MIVNSNCFLKSCKDIFISGKACETAHGFCQTNDFILTADFGDFLANIRLLPEPSCRFLTFLKNGGTVSVRDITDGDGQSGKFRRYSVNVDFKRTQEIFFFDIICNSANDFGFIFQNFSYLFDGIASILNRCR